MKYYIMYEDSSDYELTVVTRETPACVAFFIEEKINRHAYRIDDFTVIHGKVVGLKLIPAPFKVLLTS